MTREEARLYGEEYLKDLIAAPCDISEKHKEFVNMAIEALEQEPGKITLEDVKGYCKPRCLTIITNELLHELTHPKIKALKQEPCEDAISRQAVMDFIRGLTRWCVRSEDGKFNNVGLLYDDVMFGLDRLPSVTPKQKMGFDGMTNGEVIQTLFPNPHINTKSHTVWVGYDAMSFTREWWNAPYKAESEDKESE